jgi:hypothetical protein
MRTLALAIIGVCCFVPGTSFGAGPAPAPSGDVEAPADRAVEVVLPDGVTVTLEPGTRGRWLPRTKLPSETNRWALGYHLVLREGEIDVRMPPGERGAHAFLVGTREGTLTDWRGKLHVGAHGDKTAAAIYEGALVVGSNGMGFPVYDGAGVLMSKGVDPDKSRTIPAAPQWDADRSASPPFAVAPAGVKANVGFAWKAVAGAASYRVAVASDEAMTQLLEVANTTETTFAMVERAPATRTWARVRAVGPEGIAGEWSALRPLHVVHYTLPEGGVVARDGAVVLPAHGSVSLSDTDGIEVAYSRPDPRATGSVPLYWSKATAQLGVDDGDSSTRVVHLRDTNSGGETSLTLARRQLRVDIDMTPKRSRVGDPIDVHALVWDPSGHLDGAGEPVTFEAMVDIAPIAVAWERTGNAWTARVAAPSTLAPTVLRVVAKDARGTEIGRAFLELEGATASAR